jgi:hypothetical protein
MTFFDDSDFAPIIPMRDGSQVTEMEEISRGEEFIQAGVCLLCLLHLHVARGRFSEYGGLMV